MITLAPGELVWAKPDVTVRREQAGRRPVLVVADPDYLAAADTLAIVVPLTRTDRGWPNHIRIRSGSLPVDSWAMTEQVRAISRDRIVDRIGWCAPAELADVRRWLRDFLGL